MSDISNNGTPATSDACASVEDERQAKKRRTIADYNYNETMIKLYVRDSLFPRVKFIVYDDELDWSANDKSICHQCLVHLNLITSEDRVQFWSRWKREVERQVAVRRNHCQENMKKRWMSKYGHADLCNCFESL